MGHLVPDHEVGNGLAVDTFAGRGQEHGHPDRVGADAEEDGLPEGQHPRISPEQVEAEGEDGQGQILAEQIEVVVRDHTEPR